MIATIAPNAIALLANYSAINLMCTGVHKGGGDRTSILDILEGNFMTESEIIAKFKPLTHKLAFQYFAKNPEENLEDLVQIGTIGLLKAFRRFDPQKSKNQKFSFEYAKKFIRGEILHHLRDNSLIKYPRDKRREATIRTYNLETIAVEDNSDERLDLEFAIKQLPPLERRIIDLYYFQDKTHTEIATILNKNPMTVSRIRKRAESNIGDLMCSKTEAIVVNYLSQGLNNEDIAEKMSVDKRTIETHVSNILAKNKLQNRVQVVAKYYQAELSQRESATFEREYIRQLESELTKIKLEQSVFEARLDYLEARLKALQSLTTNS